MENSIEEYLELAYSYFPQGISEENEKQYRETPQFQKLTESLKQRKYLDRKWHELLSVLQKQYQCLDIGVPDRLIRGYRIAIILPEPERHYVVVNISKLIPAYSFYTLSDRKYDLYSDDGLFKFSGFSSPDLEVVTEVSEKIEFHFEGYKPFPPDLPLVPLEDVEFEERGILKDDQYRTYYQPMTLFNAFFSTNLFY
ncbi:MAG TPA: hypothetical protein VGD17_14125 [Chitinophagaceae bacterium]